MSLRHAAIAANRFGLGARPGDLKAIAGDPRGWLEAQLQDDVPVPADLRDLPPSSEIVRDFYEMRQASRRDPDAQEAQRRELRRIYLSEMASRALAAAKSERPFRERLVRFWSNHFAVSTTRPEVLPLAGAYEREAIRKNLGGRFSQLLMAAERHPAMQIYLDNLRSIGPDSPAGRRTGKGLNENHAREILELHTLGVDGGYTQRDVEQFAAILTGWGLVAGRGEVSGDFTFDPVRHQPGPKTLLGIVFDEDSEGEGKAALRMLARHPSTAAFVSDKLVRHFVSDDPPPRAVAAIEQTFTESGGDLDAVHRALVDLPEAWEHTSPKLKTPEELVISTARGLRYQVDGVPMIESVRYLGQLPFNAPSPQGWPDRALDWLGPEALLSRVDWAERVGTDAADRIDDVPGLAAELLGPSMTSRTHEAIAAAPSRAQSLALLIASPEFQRR